MIRAPIVSIVATLLVFVGAATYLAVGVLHVDPMRSRTTFSVSADESNGLRAGSPVMLLGTPIGDVTDVSYSADRIVVLTLEVDSAYSIPADSRLHIEAQSLLGESAVYVTPSASGSDRVIEDGDRLHAGTVAVPAAVPELLASTRTVIDQVDPGLVDSLVDAVETALADVEDDMATLTPAARAVAATIIESRPSLELLIGTSMRLLADGAWIGRDLRATAPELLPAAREMSRLVASVRSFTAITDGGRRITDLWKPEFQRATALLADIAPRVGGVGQALLPAAQRSGTLLGRIDIASLVENAMRALPGDRLLLTLNGPGQPKGTR